MTGGDGSEPAIAESKELAAQIVAAVEGLRPRQASFLRELVRTPSQTGDEGAAQAVVERWFREAGLEIQSWEPSPEELRPFAESVTLLPSYAGRPNVVGIERGASEGRSLVLNAHIDTVEVGDRERWTREPLGGAIEGGQIYGRGACDMKGGTATNLFALLALRAAGLELEGDLIIQSTISEEDGGAGALSAVLRGPRADAAIITEPTRRAVVPAQGGALMFRITVDGLSAHACVRDEGVSAVEKWAVVHRGLAAFEARRNATIEDPLYASIANKVPLNVGTLRSGSWASSVPEWLVAEGRAGLVPGETLEGFKREFRAELAAIAETDPWLRDHPPAVEWLGGQFAPVGIDAVHPLVHSVVAAHASIDGAPPPVEAVTYGADMRHFVLTGGMPCVMYGAGDVRLAHAPDEHLSLDELAAATATVALAAANWCGARVRTTEHRSR